MTSDKAGPGYVVGTATWLLTLALLLPLGAALTAAFGAERDWDELRIGSLLLDTAAFAGLSALVGVAWGYVIARSGLWWAALACVPLALPSSLLASAWIVTLGRTGPLGDWLTIFDWPIAAAAVGLRYIGIAALVFAAHRTGGGPAARLYPLRRAWWWLGIRPALGPAAAAFAVLFILCSADHIMPSMFLIHTYGTQVLIQYNALQDLPGAAALALPMLLPAVTAVFVIMWVIRPQGASERNEPDRVSVWPGVLVLIVAVGVPVSAIVWRTGSWSAFTESFTRMRPEAIHTFRLAVLGSLLCVLIGWVLASSWLRRQRAGRWSPVPLILTNLAAPPSMLGLGLIALSSRWPVSVLQDTDGLMVAAYAVRFVPLAALLLFIAGLRRPELPAIAARLYGVPWWGRIRYIHWPAWRGALGAAAVLCALLIATELEASLLLAPAGGSTVGVRLYTLIHTAPDQQVSAAAVAILVMLSPLIVIAGYLARRGRT